jgi:GntR family transcriptional regulator
VAVDDRQNAGDEQDWSARPAADGSGRIVSLPKYQQLADTLREQIEVGALPAGAPVPSDAELVGTYGVSQTTARSAIRKLRDLGLLITYHGRGSFVRRRSGRPSHAHPRGSPPRCCTRRRLE